MYAAASTQPVSVGAINRPLPLRQNDHRFLDLITHTPEFNVSLSIDGLTGFKRLSREICFNRHNVAYPFWELDLFPAEYLRRLREFNNVWAPSSFIYENLKDQLGKNVFLVKQPVAVPKENIEPSLIKDTLKVIFYFDFDSFPARKNPEAAVKAFRLAFPKKEDVSLTIKVRGRSDLGRRSWLFEQTKEDNRINIIDATLSKEEMTALLEAHHVYLSLHRSEGLGLGCAEALASGKFVIATDYGGTTDFINEETGFPVEWKKIRVATGDYVMSQGANWAEPSIEHAAERLRQVYDRPELAQERAASGIKHLRQHHSFSEIGAGMLQLLKDEGAIN